MKRHLLILALLILVGTALFATPLKDEFESRMMNAPTEADAITVIQTYADKMTDVEDLRFLQNKWMQIDKGACQSYFEQKHIEEPDSPEYYYLWLRNVDDKAQQLSGARDLISKSPDFYWGYRLFSATYALILTDEETPADLKKDVSDHLQNDLLLLKMGLKRFPRDDYIHLAFFHYYCAQKDYNIAESHLLGLLDVTAIQTNLQNIMDFVALSKRTMAFEVLFPKIISASIAKGDLAAKDSLSYYQTYFLEALTQAQSWETMQAYFERYPDLKTQDGTIDTRIAMEMGLKQPDTALNLLEGAMAKNLLDYPDVVDNPAYEPLHALPRWDEVIALAAKNWEKGKAERKAKALANRMDKPAPLWELSDLKEVPLRLADLKGKIVVLDFWATWCKPCRKTMPLLDSWTKAHPASDVRVISINTWESPIDRDKVIAFYQENNFAMTLLFGNNQLPKDYGFTGIPYICVIDKQGKVAYELRGYTKDLPDLLDFWTEELRK